MAQDPQGVYSLPIKEKSVLIYITPYVNCPNQKIPYILKNDLAVHRNKVDQSCNSCHTIHAWQHHTKTKELLTIQTKRRKLFDMNFEVIIDNKIKPNISICM